MTESHPKFRRSLVALLMSAGLYCVPVQADDLVDVFVAACE